MARTTRIVNGARSGGRKALYTLAGAALVAAVDRFAGDVAKGSTLPLLALAKIAAATGIVAAVHRWVRWTPAK